MMPDRDMLAGTAEVVWGVTTQANGTPFTLDFGDGSAVVAGNVADRSYIAFTHSYALAGTYTATLTVGGESATVDVRVFNAAALTPAELRGVNINRAIENGLRYQWFSQGQRATNFPSSPTTFWASGSHGNYAFTALVVAAFQNHGYRLTNNNNAPTGLYEKYVVQRGLNQVLSGLATVALAAQPAGNPCVGVAVNPCTGLYSPTTGFYYDYETPVALAAIAGSGAPARTSTAAGVTNGMTYGEVIQRLANTIVWSQAEGATPGPRGGWRYTLNGGANDGSTMGWAVLGLLDAAAAGAVVPNFAKSETLIGLDGIHNNNGSLDYTSNANAAVPSSPGIEKGGIPLQALFFGGQTAPFPAGSRAEATLKYIYDRWLGGINDSSWGCGGGNISAMPIADVLTQNFGCAYSMYNIFKGLGLQGITQLRDPTNAAAPAFDWYAQYVDWLVANQTNPTSTSGGQWASMGFSCCESGQAGKDAIALLILSPVVLVAPDPDLFSTVGLSPQTATNPVGGSHTVTAEALSSAETPIAGATVNFSVLTGPNAGKTGQGVTNAQGRTSFTYMDTGGPGTDTIQAFIGTLGSNVVEKHWVLDVLRCDADADEDVDSDDLLIIRAANRQLASSPSDPRDGNGNGRIDVADVRYCQLRCTLPGCATGGDQ